MKVTAVNCRTCLFSKKALRIILFKKIMSICTRFAYLKTQKCALKYVYMECIYISQSIMNLKVKCGFVR